MSDLTCVHVPVHKNGHARTYHGPFYPTTLPMILCRSRKAVCRKYKKMVWKMIGK